MGSGKTKDNNYKYTVLTGAQFNAQTAGIQMYKVLHSNFLHNKYKYEPDTLNSLDKTGEKFDPDPDCEPGGLYFCAEAELFRYIDMVGRPQPLIIQIKIPPDANVSIAEHKYKTDKMILVGQPVTFEAFYTDEYVSNLPIDTVMMCCFEYRRMWDIVKRMRVLVPNKFNNLAVYHKIKLLRGAVWHNDVGFLDLMFDSDDMQKLLTKPAIVTHVCETFTYMPKANDSVIGWFGTRFQQHAELVYALRSDNTV